MAISRRKAPGTAGAADEALPSAAPVPFAMTTPVRVARIGLKARDAEMLAEYYRDVVGLREMARRGASIVLGAGDRELMEIEQFSAARPDDPRSAGLYHTAFCCRHAAIWRAGRAVPLTSNCRSAAQQIIRLARQSI